LKEESHEEISRAIYGSTAKTSKEVAAGFSLRKEAS